MSALPQPPAPLPPHAHPGALVDGKYRVEAALGSGGMGMVVRAMHLALREPVALKFLHSPLAQNPTQVQRFLREAKAVVRIKSEHVAAVLDVGLLPTGEPFIVMDLLVGQDLSRLMRKRGPLPVAEAIDYVIQACRAIAEAHRHGIVHRDLKPANLFLTQRADGSPLVKVLDFGISKMMGGNDEALTATSDVLGSPVYMSPEQIRDVRRVDGRSDIWALGCILYKFLAADAPFAADTPAATLARIIADEVPPLRARRPDVPIALEQIILRCLEKTTDRRFQRVEELSQALESLRSTVPSVPAVITDTGHGHPPSLTPAPFAGTQASSATAASPGRLSSRAAAAALLVAGVVGVAIAFGLRSGTTAEASSIVPPAPAVPAASTGVSVEPSSSPTSPASAAALSTTSSATTTPSSTPSSIPRRPETKAGARSAPSTPTTPTASAQASTRARSRTPPGGTVTELPKYGQE